MLKNTDSNEPTPEDLELMYLNEDEVFEYIQKNRGNKKMTQEEFRRYMQSLKNQDNEQDD